MKMMTRLGLFCFLFNVICAGCVKYTPSGRWNETLAAAALQSLPATEEAFRVQPICVRCESDLRQSYLDFAVDTKEELAAFSAVTQLDVCFKIATRISDGRGVSKLAWFSDSFGSGNRDHFVSYKPIGRVASTGRYGYVFEYSIEGRSRFDVDAVSIDYEPRWIGSLFPSGTVNVPVLRLETERLRKPDCP